MRKYLLPSLLILALASGLGIAQTINKAIQLSQDASGAFGVDTTNNVYFPGHILNTGAAGPPTTITGTATPTLVGTDVAGTVTMGTLATQAVVAFGRAYAVSPNCMVVWNTGATGVSTPISSLVTATGIQINQNAVTGNKVNYMCTAAS